MSKHSNKHHREEQQAEHVELLTGGETPVEGEQPETTAKPEAPSTEPEAPSTEPEAPSTEPEAPSELPKMQVTMGIGQFVRHMLLKSNKTNAEILELVAKHFPESKTTAACIAWYKSDLRKKGLLAGGQSRGSSKTVALSAEDLAELVK